MKYIADNWKFILGICLFIGSLFLTVFLFSLPAKWPIWDIQSKGGTGDAINGMTAPIIGTVGAILVFISFREQVKANKIQFNALNQQRELDIVYKFYSELKEDLKEIQDTYGSRHQQPAILDSFMNQIMNDQSQHSTYNDLHVFIKYLNDQFMFLASRLLVNDILGNEESMSLIEKLRRLYGLYFGAYYHNIIQSPFQSQLSNEFKGDIKLVTDSMDHLGKYYDHLLKNEMEEALNMAKKAKKKL